MAQQQVATQLQRLPDDTLATILRRLCPRSLAASRCVCKTWRAAIDHRRLLRTDTDLLPHSLHGIFIMERLDPSPPKFIANPAKTTTRRIAAADFDYVYGHHLNIKDHCDGLLLLWDLVVVDPAARRCARLPPPPPLRAGMEDFEFHDHVCRAFDPTVSPHYQVLLLHNVPLVLEINTATFTSESEWPPSPYPVRVFSSETWTWEERLLLRRGSEPPPPGTIADMQSSGNLRGGYVVYWKGSVYMHCQNDSILRIILSDGTYEVIKPPKTDTRPRLYLAKSKEGVYCALIYSNMEHQLQVWLLTEVCGKMEWTLKTDASLVPIVAKFSWVSFDDDGNTGPWILHKGWSSDEGAEEAPTAEDNSEWDFDNGVILENEDIAEEVEGSIYFLGFHPCKEIVFLWVSEARVVAYDFSSSKVQDLGQLLVQSVGDAFPYTPCWLEELFD